MSADGWDEPPQGDSRERLLRDLESIRTLLDEDAPTPAPDAIPVLDEIVGTEARTARPSLAPTPAAPTPDPPSADGTAESGPASSESATTEEGDAASQQDLFDPRAFADRLLDDSWRAERDRIVADARRGADTLSLARRGTGGEAHGDGRAAARTAGLDDALRRALLERLESRVDQLVGEALEQLQGRLVTVLQEECSRIVDALGDDVAAPAAPENRTPGER